MTPSPTSNGRAIAWLPFGFTILAAVVAITLGWGKLDASAQQTDKNTDSIEALQGDVSALKRGQAVIQTRQKYESKIQEDYREDTKDDLKAILDQLKSIERND